MKPLIVILLFVEAAVLGASLIKPWAWWNWRLVRWLRIHRWMLRRLWNGLALSAGLLDALAGTVRHSLGAIRVESVSHPANRFEEHKEQGGTPYGEKRGGGGTLADASKGAVVVSGAIIGAIIIEVLVWIGWFHPYLPLREMAIGGAVLGVVVAVLLLARLGPAGSSTGGLATSGELRKNLSEQAVRRSGAVTRQRLDGRKATDPNEFGIFLGTAPGRRRLYAAMRDVVLVIAPPQTGKSAWMGGRIIDAPGAVVATSTKTDLYKHTAELRSSGARNVWVFNPEGLGDVPNSLRWSPLAGCENPMTAQERAGYLIGGSEASKGTTDTKFWDQSTVRVLRSLLFAAAVTERSMRDVAAWVNDAGDRTPLRILENEPSAPAGWASDLAQIMETSADKTRESVYLTLSMALQFMTDPACAAAVCPEPGDRVFSMRRFLMEGSTLYLIGSDRQHSPLSPLFASLTGYIFEEAKRIAGGGRLDPPLLLALDEAALICRVPLDRWTSDSGGRGIPLLIAVQSPSQLYDAWGERGGQTIMNNSNATMVFGGLGVARDLEEFSRLCGEREEKVQTYSAGSRGDRSRSVTPRKVPVLAPHEIRQLKDFHALLLYRSLRPVVIKTEAVWKRKDVRQLQRTGYVSSTSAARGTLAQMLDAARRLLMPAQQPVATRAPAVTKRPATTVDVEVGKVLPLPQRKTGDADEQATLGQMAGE